MDLTETEILELGQEINVAISSVTNVDEILEDTTEDLRRAEDLKARADFTRLNAEQQLKHAQEVTDSLSEALEAQNKADAGIRSAQTDIDEARRDLSEVKSNQTDMLQARLSHFCQTCVD